MKRFAIFVAAVVVALMIASPAMAHEEGSWILRAGVGTVAPESNNLTLGPGATIEVDDGTSLTLTGTYMFRNNWAFDILAAWPFSHDIELGGVKVAETDHLPPTFSLQYHVIPDGKFQPYFGLGLNYTTFFSTDTKGPLAASRLSLDDSFGLAAQMGADIVLENDWVINFDFRYISIETDATLDGANIGTVDINPWVYAIAVGRRF